MRKIRLTEGQLNRIVLNTAKRLIREGAMGCSLIDDDTAVQIGVNCYIAEEDGELIAYFNEELENQGQCSLELNVGAGSLKNSDSYDMVIYAIAKFTANVSQDEDEKGFSGYYINSLDIETFDIEDTEFNYGKYDDAVDFGLDVEEGNIDLDFIKDVARDYTSEYIEENIESYVDRNDFDMFPPENDFDSYRGY